MTPALEVAIKANSEKNPAKKNLAKVREGCLNMLDEVDIHLNEGSIDPSENLLCKVGDVLNSIEIYFSSVGMDISDLDAYRLKQIQKYLQI